MPDPPAPPRGLQMRPAIGSGLEAVVALCRRCDLADLGAPDTETGDIQAAWQRPGFDLSRDTVLVVTNAGELVGYGDVSAPHGDRAFRELAEREGTGWSRTPSPTSASSRRAASSSGSWVTRLR